MPEFSIIVPVYNTQDYVSDCIKSVLSQTFSDYECIFVNDGSTDNSAAICNEYVMQDKRFKIVHQQNSGPSIARNKGIINAQGEYIVFLDSDDVFINIFALQNLFEVIKKQNYPNTIFHSYLYSFSENQNFNNADSIDINEPSCDVCVFFKKFSQARSRILLAVCSFTINRKFILNNDLFFKENIFHEENHLFPRLLCSIEDHIAINHNLFYGYRRLRPGSTMSSFNIKRISDLITIINDLLLMAKKETIQHRKEIYYYFINSQWLYAFRLFSLYKIEDDDLKQTIIDSLNATSFCILYKTNIINVVYFFCIKIFGIKNTINIRNFLKK